MDEDFLENIDPKDIPVLAPWLGGKFYYSKQQRKELDNTHRRMFFKCTDEEAQDNPPTEYTEMIDWEQLKLDPDSLPLYDDSKFLGWGYFHSWKD